MVNLVVVATWMEYGDRLASFPGLSPPWDMAVIGWGALLLTWLVTVAVDPTRSDNRSHPERSEGSGVNAGEILRCAQDD